MLLELFLFFYFASIFYKDLNYFFTFWILDWCFKLWIFYCNEWIFLSELYFIRLDYVKGVGSLQNVQELLSFFYGLESFKYLRVVKAFCILWKVTHFVIGISLASFIFFTVSWVTFWGFEVFNFPVLFLSIFYLFVTFISEFWLIHLSGNILYFFYDFF